MVNYYFIGVEEDSPKHKALIENAGQKEHSSLEKESRVFSRACSSSNRSAEVQLVGGIFSQGWF